MKIAFIVPSLVNEGPIVVVHSLVVNLLNKVDLIHVYYFDEKHGLNFPCQTIKIKMDEPINFNSYDVIHSHCFRADKYLAKWSRKVKNKNFISVSTLHQDTFQTFSYEYNRLITYLLTYYWLNIQKKMDVVCAISNQLQNKYAPYFKKLVRIYNGCSLLDLPSNLDADFLKNIEKLKKKYKILGTYALITRRKGIIQVLRFLENNPDYAFVVIGEGPALGELKEYVDKMKLNNRVLFHPYVKVPYYYLSNVDVYVIPSYSEGFGLSMVEAALQKKAIVCSDILSFNEIFSKEEASFFTLDNKISFEKAIYKAYENRLQMGEAAYCKATLKFTASIMAENYLSLYLENIIKITNK